MRKQVSDNAARENIGTRYNPANPKKKKGRLLTRAKASENIA